METAANPSHNSDNKPEDKSNLSFHKRVFKNKKWLLFLLILLVIFFIFFLTLNQGSKRTNYKNTNTLFPSGTDTTSTDKPPLLLKSIGINLDYYDPKTGRAGDFLFTKQKLQFNRLFMGYGFFIPAGTGSKEKYNPQPTFVVPLKTPVRSLVDGVVANMPKLWSGDYSIQVTTNGQMQRWVYETEHLINPKVKVGDKVTAGQIVGEVSNFNHGAPPGFGTIEIGILKGGNPPQHICPFAYLDPSIKEDVLAKIKAFYKSWEQHQGDTILYNEDDKIPGCLTLDPIEG